MSALLLEREGTHWVKRSVTIKSTWRRMVGSACLPDLQYHLTESAAPALAVRKAKETVVRTGRVRCSLLELDDEAEGVGSAAWVVRGVACRSSKMPAQREALGDADRGRGTSRPR